MFQFSAACNLKFPFSLNDAFWLKARLFIHIRIISRMRKEREFKREEEANQSTTLPLHFLFLFLKFKMIEVTCNDRLGKKVRVKCKYPFHNNYIFLGVFAFNWCRVSTFLVLSSSRTRKELVLYFLFFLFIKLFNQIITALLFDWESTLLI